MNDQESFEYIRRYFEELFVQHNVDALDEYLDPDYFDDDIGDPAIDHIANSKEYMRQWFMAQPSIGVEVSSARAKDNVISAFLQWHVRENGFKRVIRKGVAISVLRDRKILKRHTFIYYNE
jgi:hypothetical protein